MTIERADFIQLHDVTPGVNDYPFTFGAMDAAFILVFAIDPTLPSTDPGYRVQIADAVVTPAPLGIRAGGTVHISTLPPVGHQIEIRRATAVVQSNGFEDQRKVFPKTIENGLDQLTMIAQELGGAILQGGEDIEQLQDGLAQEILDRTNADATLSQGVKDALDTANTAAGLASQAAAAARAAREAADAAEEYADAAAYAALTARQDAQKALEAVGSKADASELAKYLPLAGGIITGGLTVNGLLRTSFATGGLSFVNGNNEEVYRIIRPTGGPNSYFDSPINTDTIWRFTQAYIQKMRLTNSDLTIYDENGLNGIPVRSSLLNKLNLTGGVLTGTLSINNPTDYSHLYLGPTARLSNGNSGFFDIYNSSSPTRVFASNQLSAQFVRGEIYSFDENSANPLAIRAAIMALQAAFKSAFGVQVQTHIEESDSPLTPAEMLLDSDVAEPDVIRDPATIYEEEAKAFREAGDEDGAISAEEKAHEKSAQYLAVNQTMSESFPDGHYCLNHTGTYHLPTCSYASENGLTLTLAAIQQENPNAKPCSRCSPPALVMEDVE